jgi:hypothetical protein
MGTMPHKAAKADSDLFRVPLSPKHLQGKGALLHRAPFLDGHTHLLQLTLVHFLGTILLFLLSLQMPS